jgi:hypothetical protein
MIPCSISLAASKLKAQPLSLCMGTLQLRFRRSLAALQLLQTSDSNASGALSLIALLHSITQQSAKSLQLRP